MLDHIEKLVSDGKIAKEDLARLLTPSLKKSLFKILKAFTELETDKLTPVFEKFDGKYSYDDIRVARMFKE